MSTFGRKALPALIAAALLLASCGTSGGSDEASDTTAAAETTTTSEATTTTEAGPDPQERAEAVELTLDDFPEGWSASEPAEESIEDVLAECSDPLGDAGTVARFQNDDFTFGSLADADGAQFVTITEVYEDEDAAVAAGDDFSDPDVITCISETLYAQLDTVADATLEGALEEDDELGLDVDQGEGLFGDYTFTFADGSTQVIEVGLAFIRTGDLSTTVAIINTGESLDGSTLGQPIERIAELQAEA